MCIHLLHCVHGNECTRTHDVICNTFAAIAWNVGFHMGQKELHVLFSTTFNSSCCQINIVLTKDGIHTLVNIIIIDPTQAYLLPQSCTTQRFITFNVTQIKERSYCNQHPTNQFLPLVIEVFGYLHKHIDVFLHNCVNVIWTLKAPKGPHLSTLIIFLHKKVLITLQKMKTSCILSWW